MQVLSLGRVRTRFLGERFWYPLLLWGLAGLFIAAGVIKLANLHAFSIQIERYGLLPAAWIDPAALLLAVLEVGAGLAALFGRRKGLMAIGALLLVFIGVLGYALWQGLEVPCGCFSLDDEVRRHGVLLALLRDLVMLAAVGYLWIRRRFWAQRIFQGA
ncbi:MauE/DoxX family redox-associated membrane protein [Geoalkalibacter sp.]|uniref:MauE/DoxX family redox-associated membrane protein n=1 Tax=Geoalkalibacter sp. TaxID=3041440 RepID=UPI00272DE406|nr:MauE/DoxX family redox-associated membrane protein [Geoalkalibacter sp.]